MCFGCIGVEVLLGYRGEGNVTMSQSSGLCGGEEEEGKVLMQTQKVAAHGAHQGLGQMELPRPHRG